MWQMAQPVPNTANSVDGRVALTRNVTETVCHAASSPWLCRAIYLLLWCPSTKQSTERDAPEMWPWSSAHVQVANKERVPGRDSLPVVMK